MDMHIPAPRQEQTAEQTAEQVRERILAFAPPTMELRKRLSDARVAQDDNDD